MSVKILVVLVLLTALVESKPADDAMEIYTKCRATFGTTPTVECRSSADCTVIKTKCPEHDCLPSRSGKSFCTWMVY